MNQTSVTTHAIIQNYARERRCGITGENKVTRDGRDSSVLVLPKLQVFRGWPTGLKLHLSNERVVFSYIHTQPKVWLHTNLNVSM